MNDHYDSMDKLLGTNLAEVGTDAISRKALINKFEQWQKQDGYDNEAWNLLVDVITEIKNMPLVTDIYVGANDAISRQQAIDIVKELTITIEGYEMHNQAVMNYCAEIIQLPPIQPEPKRGKWIRTGSGSLYDHYECSECGKAPKWECMGDNRWKIAFTDFCPNCGADMRGEQDG